MIGSYDFLPRDMVLTVATFLPWVELLLGWALILGLRLRETAAACGALFGLFLLALLSVKAKGIELPNCGCFGDGIHLTLTQGLLADSVLAGLCWLAWRERSGPASLDSWTEGGYTGPNVKR